jgi:hypothetical protein
MFITCSAVVESWRTHTATHPGQSLAHPAQVCPSHNGDINMSTQHNNDDTTTNAPRKMTVEEYFQLVANMPDGHVILPPMPKIILTDLDSYKENSEYAYFTDKDGNILPPNYFEGEDE